MRGILCLAVLAFFLAAASPAGEKTIVFVPKATTATYYLFLRKGALDKARELGYSVAYEGTPDESDPMAQVDLVNRIADSKPAGMLIAAIDAKAMQPAVKRAVDMGLPVVMVDTTIEDTSIPTASLTTDNLEGGRTAGECLAKLVNGRGKVACIAVNAISRTGRQRVEGFYEAIAGHPGITAIEVRWAEADRLLARKKMTEILNEHPDLAGVFVTAGPMAIATAQAIKAKGLEKKVKIVTYDPNPENLPLFESGVFNAMVAQNPYRMGREGVEIIVRALDGGNREEHGMDIKIPVTLITPENYRQPEIQNLVQTPDKF